MKPRKPLSRRRKPDPARAARSRARADYTAELAQLYGVEVEADDTPAPPARPVEARNVSAGPRTTGPAIEKRARLRSRAWLDLVKRDPCAAGGSRHDPCEGPIDPHHVIIRSRRDDTFDPTAIPLCRRHHADVHNCRIAAEELHAMLGRYLCRMLLRLSRSEARMALEEMLSALG